jgi:hypothetical protein
MARDSPLDGLLTPDRRYVVGRARFWRAANPALSPEERLARTKGLMSARRDVARARRADDAAGVRRARSRVDRAKRELGERGPAWWTDGAPDYTRHLARNTAYAEWHARAERLGAALIALVETRSGTRSICPSDVARTEPAWRASMNEVRDAGVHRCERAMTSRRPVIGNPSAGRPGCARIRRDLGTARRGARSSRVPGQAGIVRDVPAEESCPVSSVSSASRSS